MKDQVTKHSYRKNKGTAVRRVELTNEAGLNNVQPLHYCGCSFYHFGQGHQYAVPFGRNPTVCRLLSAIVYVLYALQLLGIPRAFVLYPRIASRIDLQFSPDQ